MNDAIREAGAIAPLVALLSGEAAREAASALANLAAHKFVANTIHTTY